MPRLFQPLPASAPAGAPHDPAGAHGGALCAVDELYETMQDAIRRYNALVQHLPALAREHGRALPAVATRSDSVLEALVKEHESVVASLRRERDESTARLGEIQLAADRELDTLACTHEQNLAALRREREDAEREAELRHDEALRAAFSERNAAIRARDEASRRESALIARFELEAQQLSSRVEQLERDIAHEPQQQQLDLDGPAVAMLKCELARADAEISTCRRAHDALAAQLRTAGRDVARERERGARAGIERRLLEAEMRGVEECVPRAGASAVPATARRPDPSPNSPNSPRPGAGAGCSRAHDAAGGAHGESGGTVTDLLDSDSDRTVDEEARPAVKPTVTPIITPAVKPTVTPTVTPIITPITTPTVTPTVEPTVAPTVKPSSRVDPDAPRSGSRVEERGLAADPSAAPAPAAMPVAARAAMPAAAQSHVAPPPAGTFGTDGPKIAEKAADGRRIADAAWYRQQGTPPTRRLSAPLLEALGASGVHVDGLGSFGPKRAEKRAEIAETSAHAGLPADADAARRAGCSAQAPLATWTPPATWTHSSRHVDGAWWAGLALGPAHGSPTTGPPTRRKRREGRDDGGDGGGGGEGSSAAGTSARRRKRRKAPQFDLFG